MKTNSPTQLKAHHYPLLLVFTLSGIAALIYQICWQRLLFTAFGVDIESITIIISVFMLGLGLGALAGGRLADKYPHKIILFFSLFEFLIGIFGFSSPYLIDKTSNLFFSSSIHVIGFVIFLLLLLPTSLMGATLPMLTYHLNLNYNNVGTSIGRLYFSNTIGAAIGSFATGFILFRSFTLIECIFIAALMNITVAIIALIGIKK
jgi:predicted membrane-bound spermidine synthase